MLIWIPLGVILLSGAVGGVINALFTNNGFILPREEIADKVYILRPGVLGNVLLGSIAAFMSWGLYGAYSGAIIFGDVAGSDAEVNLSLSAISGAILIGIGGAKWLTNETDKKLLKTAVATAAAARPTPEDSKKMLVSTLVQTFNLAKNMH
jgi:hypothetical protein